MDYLYPHLLTIQKELVRSIFKNFSLQSDELLFDGTSFKSFGMDQKDDQESVDDENIGELKDENEESPYIKSIKRLKGYPRDKRKDLAQINYMLGIN